MSSGASKLAVASLLRPAGSLGSAPQQASSTPIRISPIPVSISASIGIPDRWLPMRCAMKSIGRWSSTPAMMVAHPVQNQGARSPTIMKLELVVVTFGGLVGAREEGLALEDLPAGLRSSLAAFQKAGRAPVAAP